MATEVVKIKFEADTTGLKSASSDVKVLEDQLKKAGVSAEFMDDALDEVGKTLKEANVDAKTFTKALADSSNNTKSLRSQLAEARNEAIRLSAQFGAFSKEAREAAKRAAEIKDQIGDLNDTLDALNPEAKLNAFVKLGQGIQGGFQAATGALQVFGVENERITKLAQQFQGVLNLTQGINSVLQLKDVYGQLRLVLGLTTTAQTGLNVATNTGTLATRGLTAALLANPFTAVAVAVAALVTGIIAYTMATEDSTEATRENNAETEEAIEKQNRLAEAYSNSVKEINRSIDDARIRLSLARGEIDELTAKLQQNELNRQRAVRDFIAQYGQDIFAIAKINEKFGIEAQLIRAEAQAKKTGETLKQIPRALKAEFIETNDDIVDEIKILAERIQAELDKIQPISVKSVDSGIRETLDFVNLQVQEVNKQILQASLQTFDNLLDAQSQGRIDQLEQEKKAGLITEEQYAKEVSKIKRKAALQDRAFAVFNVALSTAEAIMKVTAQLGTFAPPLIAAYIALGAAQTAAILSQPLPKFKQGTLNVGGGNLDPDGGMHAIIHRGEAVIPKDRNQAYHPTIAAIFHKRISPAEINSFVDMKLKGRIPNDINAKINAKDLRTLKPSESVSIRNSATLAKQIGREIAYNINPRRS